MLPPQCPPHPKRVYYSYFERRPENESFDDEEDNVNVVDEAKRLKHEADQETNMNNRCRKYLQVTVNKHQVLSSCELELLTLDLIRLATHESLHSSTHHAYIDQHSTSTLSDISCSRPS